MSIKLKKSIKLINQIQKIRSKNNKNWMDIVKLALQLDFNSTTKILNQIYKEDSRIGKITKKIKNLNK
tara:strand:+ start:181 stop:384 length:204 start_codon:yes stop_codon:yes gene_type:complete